MSEVQKILERVAQSEADGFAYMYSYISEEPEPYLPEDAEQALYDLLMEKMPEEITERETTVASLYPGHAKEIHNDAQGYNRAVKQMVSAIKELFGRTE